MYFYDAINLKLEQKLPPHTRSVGVGYANRLLQTFLMLVYR